MRTSSAEQSTQQGSGIDSGRRFSLGSRLRPSESPKKGEDPRRGAMTGKRGNGRGWEIRLGALQVVVWLGLALGAVFGAYFIGYLSGRYVGFETAREASGIEVPKLALTDEYPERSGRNEAIVYNKLNSNAVVTQDPKPQNPAKPAAQENRVAKPSTEQESDTQSKSEPQVAPPSTKGDALSDADAIFSQDVGSGVVELDRAASEGSAKAGEVRVLGREYPSEAAQKAPVAPAQKEKVAPESPKVELAKKGAESEIAVPQKAPSTEKVVAKEVKKEPSLVTKTPSAGFFAQVAAPNSLKDAEEVAKKLKRSGFPVTIESASVGRSPFYRVLVGPEQNKVQVDRLVGQLKREPYLTTKPIVRQVK